MGSFKQVKLVMTAIVTTIALQTLAGTPALWLTAVMVGWIAKKPVMMAIRFKPMRV